MYETRLGSVIPDEKAAEAMHVLTVNEMRTENDEDKCSNCGVRPVWIGTMCRQCAEGRKP